MRDAFAAMPMDYLYASDQRSLIEWPSLDEGDAGAWSAPRSALLSETAPYRMACSCSTTDISRYHVDTTVPQLVADLCSGRLIKVSVKFVATTTIDGRGMVGDLLIAFARIGRPQFVEAVEAVHVEDVPCRTDDFLLEIEVAFVRCKQVTATVWRDLFGKPQRVANMIIYRNPARCRLA